LAGHVVETAYERDWSGLQNGALITAAQDAGFDVFVTTDRNLKYQQNLRDRKLAIVVLMTTSWPRIRRHLPLVAAAVDRAGRGLSGVPPSVAAGDAGMNRRPAHAR
jgi:hypothetical protein